MLNLKVFDEKSNRTIEIKAKPEYEQLVPPLTLMEYTNLKQSIKENKGNIIPILVNEEGIIIDGHHRFKACQEFGITPKIETKEFADELEEKEFIIYINRNRRQLNTYQIAELATKLEEIEREKAKRRLSQAGKLGADIRWKAAEKKNEYRVGPYEPTPFEEKGKAVEIIAKKMGISPTTYFRSKKINEDGSAEQKKKLREGKGTINKEYNKIRKSKKRQELLNSSKQNNNIESSFTLQQKNNDNDYNNINNNNYTHSFFRLIEGDLSEKGNEISDESIDFIFTDPPYSTDSIHIYSELAVLANRVLKPGGSIVTYIGQHNLPEILDIFTLNHLKYWWPIAVKHTGPTKAFHQRKVFVLWKPLLWFVKGDKLSTSYPIVALNEYLYDYIESKPVEKILHPWEQSPIEAEHVIKKLTIESQIVLDPLMGSGTTGIAALTLGRRFIGIEKEQGKFKIAEERLVRHILANNNIVSSSKIDLVSTDNKIKKDDAVSLFDKEDNFER